MSTYKKYVGDLFVTLRFYTVVGGCVLAYIASFFYAPLYAVVNIAFAIVCLLVLADYLFLFVFFKPPTAQRRVGDRLSNGEVNDVAISITNKMPFVIKIVVTDELPEQLQERNMKVEKILPALKNTDIKYSITPVQRGAYHFGDIIIFFNRCWGFCKKEKRWRLQKR